MSALSRVTPFPVRPMADTDAKDQRKQMHLRCREHVALALYGSDFSRLSRTDQNRIIQQVSLTISIYDLAREGYFTPLPVGCSRRAELEPELFRGSAS